MRLAALLLVVGCANTLAKPPKPDAGVRPVSLARTHAVPGEAIEYQVDLRGLTIGRVMVTVGKAGFIDGRRAIIMRSRGASAGLLSAITDLRWELTSTLALETGELLHEAGGTSLKFNGEEEHDSYDRDGDGIRNVHAAAGALRAWRSRIGERANLEVTIEGATIDVEIWDEARELVGGRPAVRYSGIALSTFPFSVWISDDLSRVPLLVRTESKWGTIVIELVHYDVDGA